MYYFVNLKPAADTIHWQYFDDFCESGLHKQKDSYPQKIVLSNIKTYTAATMHQISLGIAKAWSITERKLS